MLGTLQPLNTGYNYTRALGFIGKGGTLTNSGMLFLNRCTWAHILVEAAGALDVSAGEFLSPEEFDAINGKALPEGVVI